MAENSPAQRVVREALRRAGEPPADRPWEDLGSRAHLTDEEWEVAGIPMTGVKALEKSLGSGDPSFVEEAAETLCRIAMHGADRGARVTALDALAAGGHSFRHAAHHMLLLDQAYWVRLNAAGRVNSQSDSRALDLLTDLLSDDDILVRNAARNTFQKIGKPAVEPLIASLHNGSPPAQAMAAIALGRMREKSAIAELTLALERQPASRHSTLLSALHEIGDPLTAPLFAQYLNSSPNCREIAVDALSKWGIYPEGVALIKAAQCELDPRTLSRMQRALQRIEARCSGWEKVKLRLLRFYQGV